MDYLMFFECFMDFSLCAQIFVCLIFDLALKRRAPVQFVSSLVTDRSANQCALHHEANERAALLQG